MSSSSDSLQEFSEVNENINAVPIDINSRIAEISGKESVLKQFAKKCKIQANEIKQRTATLNMYANNLLVIDTNLKKEKNAFTQEINNQFADLNEHENELNEEINCANTQHQENEKRIELIEQMKAKTNELCEENENQYQTLTKRLEELNEKPIPKEDDVVPDSLLDEYRKKVKKNKEKSKPIEDQIEKENQNIATIESTRQSIIEKIERVNKRRSDVRKLMDEESETQDQSITGVNRKMAKAKKNIEKINQLHVDLEAHSLSLKSRAVRIQKRIDTFANKEIKLNNAIDAARGNGQTLSNNLNELQAQIKQYRDAYEKRREFYKNIDISNQRAAHRTNEISTELATTRDIQKKTDIEQFETEMKIEKCIEQENDLNEEVGKIEQEMTIVEQQENESTLAFNETQNELSQIEESEKMYQDQQNKLSAENKQLKGKIKEAHNDERLLIEAYKKAKAGLCSESDPEIKEEQESINAFVNGYTAKLQFINDSIKTLKAQIKTGELRSAFYNSEYKRSSVICSTLSSQIIQSPMRTRVTKKDQNVTTEISRLESAIKEKKTSIKNLEASIATKSRAQINDTQETNYQEVLNQRMKIANDFITQAEKLLDEVQKAKNGFNDNEKSLRDVVKVSEWNEMISKMVDNAEDIEMEAELI